MRIKITILILFIGILFGLYKSTKVISQPKLKHEANFSSNIPQVELYYCIIKYAKEYNIPEGYLFAIANHETGYRGLNDIHYKHDLSSSASAIGPMQVKLSTAKMFISDITYHELRNNIDSNVKVSAMALIHLYEYYGSWELAFGAYNTGKPIKNSYAKYIANKNFNWK